MGVASKSRARRMHNPIAAILHRAASTTMVIIKDRAMGVLVRKYFDRGAHADQSCDRLIKWAHDEV